MTIQRSASVTEALYNLTSEVGCAGGDGDEVTLTPEDGKALLAHIEGLEFEISRANGTIAINALHESFIRRSE